MAKVKPIRLEGIIKKFKIKQYKGKPSVRLDLEHNNIYNNDLRSPITSKLSSSNKTSQLPIGGTMYQIGNCAVQFFEYHEGVSFEIYNSNPEERNKTMETLNKIFK